ncbi:MAG: iron ABC transporter permease [bacterium]
MLLSLSLGVENVSLRTALQDPDSLARTLLFEVRLPRVLLGALVGLSLSVSGMAFQALLRNPLADPFILGVSGGAALGSVLAVGLHLAYGFVPVAAFLSALASMFLIYKIAQVKGRLNPHTLLLVGVLFNTTTFSLILFINSVVSMEDLHRIWFLMVGSLEAIEYNRLAWISVLIFIGLGVLIYDATALNLIPLGEESAKLLGVDVEAVRKRVFFSASLMVGATVSVCGLVGFVGLAVPHMVRWIFGSDHRRVLPACAIGGAGFLVLADLLTRISFSRQSLQTQLPVGVVTALIGAPLFFFLLRKKSLGR